MIKVMQLVSVGALQEREFKKNDGSVKQVKFRMLTFTDGVDSIYGETSERLTGQTEATDANLRLQLKEGHVYNVDFNIRASEYEKDGKKGVFVGITINKLFHLV